MARETASNPLSLRIIRLFQIRLARLMVLVASIAILLTAWMYNRDYGNSERAWTSTQLLALNHGDAAGRKEAAENLYTVEQEDLARTAAPLAGALSDPDWPVRVAAARSLANVIVARGGIKNHALTKEFNFATMALIPVCRDPRDEVRIEAAEAVGKLYDSFRISRLAPGLQARKVTIGQEARLASNALSQAMHDPSPKVRAKALWSFARVGRLCGEDARPVEALAEHDPETKVRIAALNSLTTGWPEDQLLYPFLLGRLNVVTDQEEHAAIAWAIGGLDPPSKKTRTALLNALSPDDRVLRHNISLALGKLGTTYVLGSTDPSERATLSRVARIELADPDDSFPTVLAMMMIAPESPEAQALIEPLIKVLKDPRPAFQQSEAVNLLVRFGPSAAVVNGLRVALKSKDEDVRKQASVVLGRVGATAVSAIPDLTTLARDDPDSNVKLSAADALKRINWSVPANSAPWPYPLP